MRKLIVCIADGAADDPSLCPKGTPLERAETPFLDSMTRHSVAGLCYTIPDGFSPDSDVGNMSLFGYDPAKYHNGRAPIEAAALGIQTSENDLIWRVTFCRTENEIITEPCASSLTQKEGKVLIAALNAACDDSSYTFMANKAYRHLMIQKNGRILLEEHNRKLTQQGKSPLVTSGPHMLQHMPLHGELSRYPASLQAIIQKASQVLTSHTAKTNALWLWGEGNAYTLPDFATKYTSNACIISGIPLLHGLGHMAGMQVITHPAFTGHPDTDLTAKANAALAFLQEPQNNIAFIHVEAPDHCGHIGDAEGKRKAIERIDSELLPILLDKMPSACIAITADHLTPAATKSHAHGAVPFIAYHRELPEQTAVQRFTEAECKKGVHLSKDTILLSELKQYYLTATATDKDLNLKK
ncbi:alkaline phosphatase family protein [Halodesulfovibrio marinisediminis]|uniref:2,3-bisphosphoglycerate-independent phosphoglycerate mutase n=1 Tax=Halodesulfovibrio marinisediminis DSM 17456 TaxID=1121457 RepID=A0A1N6IK00_9BACT|nr:alkaline phosphatase family protein [Halodesulfovibrio marinisediminis]SIO32303.1 2,3-bisphosphoglycerate-independent phosphoglycerate mutase [Halodesulfovibrio marinisediminis DSM 17456]